jgi:hypothetical protein
MLLGREFWRGLSDRRRDLLSIVCGFSSQASWMGDDSEDKGTAFFSSARRYRQITRRGRLFRKEMNVI